MAKRGHTGAFEAFPRVHAKVTVAADLPAVGLVIAPARVTRVLEEGWFRVLVTRGSSRVIRWRTGSRAGAGPIAVRPVRGRLTVLVEQRAEGVTWIRGRHAPNSKEAQALLAAALLVNEPGPQGVTGASGGATGPLGPIGPPMGWPWP